MKMNLIRLCVIVILLLESLYILGYWPYENIGLFWTWLVYLAATYLLMFEFPMFYFRHDAQALKIFFPIGYFAVLAILGDALGYLLNLFQKFHYDVFTHMTTMPFLIATFATSVTVYMFNKRKISDRTIAFMLIVGICCFFFIMHELIEFAMDYFTQSNLGTAANHISDTGKDLLNDMIGVVIYFAAGIYRFSALKFLPKRKA